MSARRRIHGRLQLKLVRVVILLVTVMFAAFFLLVARDAFDRSRQREIDNQRARLNRTAAQIASIQNTVENLSKLVVANGLVQGTIYDEGASLGRRLYAMRKLSNTLKELQYVVNGVEEITLYSRDGRTITSRYDRGDLIPEQTDWFQDFLASGRRDAYTGVHRSVPWQSGYTIDIVTYICHCYSIGSVNERLGTLIINLDFDEIRRVVQLDSDMLDGYWLLDETGAAMLGTGAPPVGLDRIQAGMENGVAELDGSIFVVSRDMNGGWTLVSEIALGMLKRQAVRSIVNIFFAFAVMLALASVLLWCFIRHVVTPINQLSLAAAEVGRGNLDARVNIHTGDEIEDLADAFNAMVVNINGLIEKSVAHEKMIQQMQTENLMLQINPHFIYNTMNSIVYMARMNGNRQIAEFTNAFISLLQNTLKVRASVFVTLEDELCTVRHYLYLQTYRYGEKITYEINCPEELLRCQILNVMLQPVVENAIFHGIAPKDGPGHIAIEAAREGDALCVTVMDDGVGISDETLGEIVREDYTQSAGMHRIGIGNVRKRIREIYGEQWTLDIQSELGQWTRVQIRIPYVVEAAGE